MMKATQLPVRAGTLLLGTSLAASLAAPLLGQDFGPRQELTDAIGEVQDAAVVDLDGDGNLDILLASTTAIFLFPGGPAGDFLPKQTLRESIWTIETVTHADLDGDGDSDLLYSTSDFDRIIWSENLGGGVFGQERTIEPSVFNATGLGSADLDGDGDLDVYAASSTNDEVFWVENLGALGFGPRSILPDSDGIPAWVDAGDVDGDGDIDLLASLFGDQVLALWENLGSGTFGPKQEVASPSGGQDFVRLADLNGDGNLDALVLRSAAFGASGSWYLGNGTGGFGSENPIFQPFPGVSEAEIADIDSDDKPDLVLGSGGIAPLAWLKNSIVGTSGGFSNPITISEQATGLGGFPIADVDGNGTLDVVAASASQDNLTWYSNTGFGGFNPKIEISSQAAGAVEALTVDFDGDGRQDVVSLSTNDRKLAVYPSLGDGSFDTQRALFTVPPGQVCMDAGDLDGDGDPDFVVGGLSPAVLAWYPNLGNGLVGTPNPILVSFPDAVSVQLNDINADGQLDILVASQASNTVFWIPGAPGTGFGSPQIIASDAMVTTTAKAFDMDGDGDLDVLYTSQSSSNERVLWRENLGGGSFGATIPIPTSAFLGIVRDVEAVDVDGDGLMDVIACGSGTRWYENTGSNTYANGSVIGSGPTRGIDAADVDGDGASDVLVAKNSELNWHRRTGFGGWSLPKLIEEDLEDPRSARLADVDGDGDLDVLFAGGEGNTVHWYENLVDPSIGVADCDPAVLNSTGQPGTLTGTGSPLVASNALALTASHLPPNEFGLFLASPDAGLVAGAGGGQGTLCLSGPIGRFQGPGQLQSSGPSGVLSIPVDLTQIPSPSGFASILIGEQWHFQVWHRDQNPGPTSNFTNGLVVEFE